MNIYVLELRIPSFHASALDIDCDFWQNPRFVPEPGQVGIVAKHLLHPNTKPALLGHVVFVGQKQFGSRRSVPEDSAPIDDLLECEAAWMPVPALLARHILAFGVLQTEVFFHRSNRVNYYKAILLIY